MCLSLRLRLRRIKHISTGLEYSSRELLSPKTVTTPLTLALDRDHASHAIAEMLVIVNQLNVGLHNGLVAGVNRRGDHDFGFLMVHLGETRIARVTLLVVPFLSKPRLVVKELALFPTESPGRGLVGYGPGAAA